MNEQDLKLQAHFDGELPEAEARQVMSRLARDSDAVALLHTLKSTRQALSTFEAGIKVPETREFYWSKIRRGIEVAEASEARVQPVRESLLFRLRRLLVPAAGVALIVIAGMVLTRDDWAGRHVELETALADSKAFTYRDYASGTTLVWLSYPAEQENSAGVGGTID